MSGPGLLLGVLLVVSIPPLTPEQRTRLATAVDGGDHREEAFVALLEHAARFAEADPRTLPGPEPVRLRPDLDALLTSPDLHRGDLCRVTGVLQQRSRLERAYGAPWEWFVRDQSGRPVLVYVTGPAGGDETVFPVGAPIAVYARFYKRVDAVARDGRSRAYPAFVGARPWRTDRAAGVSPGAFLALAALLLGGLLVVFVVVAALARGRPRRARPRRVVLEDGAVEEDDDESLPDDPVAALEALRRRAEDQVSSSG